MVFTTGEAARICRLSQQTIIRCFDSGRLEGFRVPGSTFRRIPRESLMRFMEANNIPTDALRGDQIKLLVVDDDPDILELFTDAVAGDSRFELRTAQRAYEAGIVTQQFLPDVVVLDLELPDVSGQAVCKAIRQHPDLKQTKVVIISGRAGAGGREWLNDIGADEFVAKPFGITDLLARIGKIAAC